MKAIIIKNSKLIAIVKDNHSDPQAIELPEDFDINNWREKYKIVDNQLTPLSIEELAQIKLKKLRDLRRQKEQEGIIIQTQNNEELHLGCDLATRSSLQSTIQSFDLFQLNKTSTTISWKFTEGQFRELTYDNLLEIKQFIFDYVEKLFKAEKTHTDSITNIKTKEDLETYDLTKNWPDNIYTSQTIT